MNGPGSVVLLWENLKRRYISTQCKIVLSPREVAEKESHIAQISNTIFEKTKVRQRQKFDNLVQRKQQGAICRDRTPREETVDRSRWVVDISKHELGDSEHNVLEKGLNFAVTPKSLPIKDYLVSTELACKLLSCQQKGCNCARVIRLTAVIVSAERLDRCERAEVYDTF